MLFYNRKVVFGLNERVKQLRKILGLTLEKFGERVGVTKVSISKIENSKSNVSEQMFKSICREFQVSEEWLRNGTGEMFVTHDIDDEFAMIAGEIMVSDEESFKTAIIEAWKRPELRKLVKEYMKALQEKQ